MSATTTILAASATATRAPIAGYVPSSTLAYVGIVAFGLVAIAFAISLFKWYGRYMLTLTIGTTCMAIGFGIRIAVHSSPTTIGPFIAMTMFILLSPCAFLASNYIILPILAAHINKSESLPLGARVVDGTYRKPRMAKYFVWSDVVTFFLQCSGGGLQAAGTSGNSNMPKIGMYVALVGLALQLLSFSAYIVLLVRFGRAVSREDPQAWYSGANSHSLSSPTGSAGSSTPMKEYTPGSGYEVDGRLRSGSGRNVKWLWWALIISSAGFMVRSIFRVAEYATTREGYLSTHEWAFYCLDSLPLLLSISLFVWFWPPRWMPASEKRETTIVGRAYA